MGLQGSGRRKVLAGMAAGLLLLAALVCGAGYFVFMQNKEDDSNAQSNSTRMLTLCLWVSTLRSLGIHHGSSDT